MLLPSKREREIRIYKYAHTNGTGLLLAGGNGLWSLLRLFGINRLGASLPGWQPGFCGLAYGSKNPQEGAQRAPPGFSPPLAYGKPRQSLGSENCPVWAEESKLLHSTNRCGSHDFTIMNGEVHRLPSPWHSRPRHHYSQWLADLCTMQSASCGYVEHMQDNDERAHCPPSAWHSRPSALLLQCIHDISSICAAPAAM